MFEDMEEIDRSDDGKIRLYRVGPITNDEIPDTPDVKNWRALYSYCLKEERCGNCNFWEHDSWVRNTWCNLMAKECNADKPYAPRDGWCERWKKNCTIEQWKSKNHYDGWTIMYLGGRVNSHPRPTKQYNCTTCPAATDAFSEYRYCAVAEKDTGYRSLLTSKKNVCELHPDTEKMMKRLAKKREEGGE